MTTARTSRTGASPQGLFAAAIAFLLPLVFHPDLLAAAWTLRAALLLLVIAVGAPRLVLLVRSDRRGAALLAVAALVATGLSTIGAERPALAFFGAYYWGTGWLFVLALVCAWALGASLDEEGRSLTRRALLAGILVNAIVGLVQGLVDTNVVPFTRFEGRSAGLLGNPIHLGALAAGGLALLVTAGRSARALGAAVVLAAALQLSGSRTALALVGALLVFALVRRRRAAVPFVLVIVAGLALGAGISRIGGSETGSARLAATTAAGGATARTHTWWSARHAVADHPVLGSGPGQFRSATSRYRTLTIARAEGPGRYFFDAHNVVVEYTVTTGLLGLATIAAFVLAAARRARGPMLFFALVVLGTHLLEPQFVATTPLALLALGAALPRGTVPRPGTAVAVATGALALVAVAAGARLVVGDFHFNQALLDFDRGHARRAVALLPPWPDPRELAGRVEIYAAITERDPRRLAAAAAWAERAQQVDPTAVSPKTLLGDVRLRQGDYAGAAAAYRQALRDDPWFREALVGLREMARATGQHEDARAWDARLRRLEDP